MNLLAPPRARLQIEVVFDLVCPWCYLGTRRLRRALRARPDILADILWRPFLLGPIFKDQGWQTSPFVLQKAKGDYVWKDMVRQCEKHGLPWKQPSAFPRASVLPLRVALIGAHKPWMGDYCRAVMSRNFAADADINSVEAVEAILHGLSLPADEIMAEALSDANKLRLRQQTQMAADKGIFGAPTFFVGQEMFWGNDRLDDALACCAAQRIS